MAKVKISALANYNDALDATNLGADFLGFHFFSESPKKVSEKLASDVISKMPPFVSACGAFKDADHKQITKTVKKCGLKLVEFCGVESPEFCKAVGVSLNVKTLKQFKLTQESDILTLNEYKGNIDYFILDITSMQNVDGAPEAGTRILNLNLAKNAETLSVPFFIAGDITAQDILKISEVLSPFGFDGDIGIERLPKRKDYDKMNSFIRYAHGLK
ncbi:MAG: phosphoribosylanthranilate isomerase [Elusimicrobia bacterium]|nr:phosphoribosylanthranilate isomerase [Elusimicrobiota bacterium]